MYNYILFLFYPNNIHSFQYHYKYLTPNYPGFRFLLRKKQREHNAQRYNAQNNVERVNRAEANLVEPMVEKQLGAKVEKNRIVNVIGDEEYYFGIMTTQPNDKYGIAVWVLAKGNDLCLKTDTCEVDKEEGRVYWSSFDPDEYMEPVVIAVVKGADGLDIYCMHATTDETMNYMLMRQKGNKMQKYDMGGFYQQYE